jgi:hypothetical protein
LKIGAIEHKGIDQRNSVHLSDPKVGLQPKPLHTHHWVTFKGAPKLAVMKSQKSKSGRSHPIS